MRGTEEYVASCVAGGGRGAEEYEKRKAIVDHRVWQGVAENAKFRPKCHKPWRWNEIFIKNVTFSKGTKLGSIYTLVLRNFEASILRLPTSTILQLHPCEDTIFQPPCHYRTANKIRQFPMLFYKKVPFSIDHNFWVPLIFNTRLSNQEKRLFDAVFFLLFHF